jgi:hypothetical protein
MIRLSRRPSHGRRQALSLVAAVAAVRIASAIPKHTVVVAQSMYGVSRDKKLGIVFNSAQVTTLHFWAGPSSNLNRFLIESATLARHLRNYWPLPAWAKRPRAAR